MELSIGGFYLVAVNFESETLREGLTKPTMGKALPSSVR
jgi:hypothetical protein